MNDNRITIYMSDHIRDKITKEASLLDTTLSGFILAVLKGYFNEREKENKMKYNCIIKKKEDKTSFESGWHDSEADARRKAWELTGRKRGNFHTDSRTKYNVKIEKRAL